MWNRAAACASAAPQAPRTTAPALGQRQRRRQAGCEPRIGHATCWTTARPGPDHRVPIDDGQAGPLASREPEGAMSRAGLRARTGPVGPAQAQPGLVDSRVGRHLPPPVEPSSASSGDSSRPARVHLTEARQQQPPRPRTTAACPVRPRHTRLGSARPGPARPGIRFRGCRAGPPPLAAHPTAIGGQARAGIGGQTACRPCRLCRLFKPGKTTENKT